ncbi:MAG: RcnB family protein [Caulobacter sp.]
MKKFLTAAIALSVLASAGVASAQPYQGRSGGYQQGYDSPRGDRRDERRDDRYDRRDDRAGNRYERRAERRYYAGRYQAPRGYQARQWRRGEYLPRQYRGNAYGVDYRRYRLPPPPRGYQYTRVNDDVVLTAIATGLIASVVFNMFQ